MTDKEFIDKLGWWVFENGFTSLEAFEYDLLFTKTPIRNRAKQHIITAWNLGQYRYAEYSYNMYLESKNLLS